MLAIRKRKSCVYFLVDRGEVVYIGKTVRLPARLVQHIEDHKRFDRVLYFHIELSNAPRVEVALIKLLDPKYNAPSIAGRTRAEHLTALVRYRRALGILEGP